MLLLKRLLHGLSLRADLDHGHHSTPAQSLGPARESPAIAPRRELAKALSSIRYGNRPNSSRTEVGDGGGCDH